jgi:hypothetical protein
MRPRPDAGPATPGQPAERWPTGALVLWRYRRRGQVSHVQTARVVADDGDWLALHWAEGYPRIDSIIADGRALKDTPAPDRYLLPRIRRRAAWTGAGSRVLCMVPRPAMPPTALASGPDNRPAYSIWLMWDAGEPACYYINLESPHRLWQDGNVRGLDTEDHELDIVVSPDRSGWRFKDEAEFEVATGLPGYWSAADVPGIRAAGEVALARVRSLEPALDNWAYQPDPTWTTPEIPPNWDYEP